MRDMKLDPRWLDDARETLKHLLIEAVRDGETSEAQAEKLATFALNGFTSLSEQWRDISSIPPVAIQLSEKTDALQRRLQALHQQITGKSFNQGCGEENDYPRTSAGFALERLSNMSCDLHLINGMLDSIESALAAQTEDWAEVLDQRQRERDAAKERFIPSPEKITSPSFASGEENLFQDARWIIDIKRDMFHFSKFVHERPDELYAPVSREKAAVFAAAILNGLQPPRDLRPSDKLTD